MALENIGRNKKRHYRKEIMMAGINYSNGNIEIRFRSGEENTKGAQALRRLGFKTGSESWILKHEGWNFHIANKAFSILVRYFDKAVRLPDFEKKFREGG